MQKKVYLILLLVVTLVLGAWSFSSANNVAAQPAIQETPACREAAGQLVGNLAQLPRVENLIRDTCDFRVRVNEIPSDASEFDKLFIENAIAANMIEIESLQVALENTTNEEWRGLINTMIIMHTSDLEMAMRVAEKIDVTTKPNLQNARVYPETPDYDLGKRRVDLLARFLAPLVDASGGGGTPTVIPTDTGIVPTETTTELPTDTATLTATAIPTDMSTVTVTSSPSAFTGRFVSLLQTDIPTDTATVTATALPTDTVTETATALPTDTATALPTDTATATETATTAATDTATATETATAIVTATATGSLTAVPTDITPGPGTAFDLLAMDIIEDEHAMSLGTALVAQRLVKNDEIRAFAKHSADVIQLHMILLNDLKYRVVHNITLPPPHFQEDYQSPRRFTPR